MSGLSIPRLAPELPAPPVLIDAHAHLDEYADDELDRALVEIAGQRILTTSTAMDPASYRRAQAIGGRCPFVLPAFGIHPWKARDWVDWLDELSSLTAHSPMLGEIGLDHRFVEDTGQYPAQRRLFERFLNAARAHRKIANLHTSGAEAEVLDLLRAHAIERPIVHWYAGPLDVLDGFIRLGAYFSIGVEVLTSPHIQEIARRVPADQLLTETDNPNGLKWLTGIAGRPAILADVVVALAAQRGTSSAATCDTVAANWARLVGPDPAPGTGEPRRAVG